LLSKGILVIVSGPSGVGKDTILDKLEETYPLSRCRTSCTRSKREWETDGVDYDFLTKEDFKKKIEENYFIEYANVHDNWYGTPKKSVEDLINKGETVILKIDVQGAVNVKKSMPDSVLIFILPPDTDTLKERLLGRNSESEETANLRLKNATDEINQSGKYDYQIINDNLDDAINELRTILIREKGKANG